MTSILSLPVSFSAVTVISSPPAVKVMLNAFPHRISELMDDSQIFSLICSFNKSKEKEDSRFSSLFSYLVSKTKPARLSIDSAEIEHGSICFAFCKIMLSGILKIFLEFLYSLLADFKLRLQHIKSVPIRRFNQRFLSPSLRRS